MTDPFSFAAPIALRDGRLALARPLAQGDVEPLAAFFLGLSEVTKSRYGPHPFDRPTAERLCGEAGLPCTVRFVAELEGAFIGYIILTRHIWPDDVARYGGTLRLAECACFAPVIADAYQEQGLGTQMARHVLVCAQQMGLKQVILMGGVMAENPRARRLYERIGFQYRGEFWADYGRGPILNYNMIVEW